MEDDPEVREDDQSTIGKPGDPMMDPKTEPGYILLGLGAIAFVLALIAGGLGRGDLLTVAIIACVVLAGAGGAWIAFERGRMKKEMRNAPPEVTPGMRRRWRSSKGA